MSRVNLFLISLFFLNIVVCYEVPPAKLEAIFPLGLRVSIPGILLFICLLPILNNTSSSSFMVCGYTTVTLIVPDSPGFDTDKDKDL